MLYALLECFNDTPTWPRYHMEGNFAGGTLAIDYEFAKFIPTKLYALKLILDMFNLETAETN